MIKMQRTSVTSLLIHDSYAVVLLSVYKLTKTLNFGSCFYDDAFSRSVSWYESTAWSDDVSLFCFLLSIPLVVHKVKVHIVTAGETFEADNVLLSHVRSSGGLQLESTDQQGCSIIILFCPISSRVGSDMKAAMKKVSGKLLYICVSLKCGGKNFLFFVLFFILSSLSLIVWMFSYCSLWTKCWWNHLTCDHVDEIHNKII